jgi:hypothetical protein
VGLACAVSLDIEQPHHEYLVLASVFDHVQAVIDLELGEFSLNNLEPDQILTCLHKCPGAARVVNLENIQCEVGWVLVQLILASEVVPVHNIRFLTGVENSWVLQRRVRWYRRWRWWCGVLHRRVRGSRCRLRRISVGCLVENEVRVKQIIISVALEVVLRVVKYNDFRQADLTIHSLAVVSYNIILLELN